MENRRHSSSTKKAVIDKPSISNPNNSLHVVVGPRLRAKLRNELSCLVME
jgi:hypothetical protein